MTRRLAVMALLTAAAGLASCDRETGPAADKVEPAAATARAETPVAATAPAAPEPTSLPAGEAIEGAPAFAVVYPGGVVETTPLNGPNKSLWKSVASSMLDTLMLSRPANWNVSMRFMWIDPNCDGGRSHAPLSRRLGKRGRPPTYDGGSDSVSEPL